MGTKNRDLYTRSLVLFVCFVDRCLSFFLWPLCCLSLDLRILITPLVSSLLTPERIYIEIPILSAHLYRPFRVPNNCAYNKVFTVKFTL
jgi:hypothetical protein